MSYPHYALDCEDYHGLVRDFGGPRRTGSIHIGRRCGDGEVFQQANHDHTMAGSSTRAEVEYAQKIGRPIHYLEPGFVEDGAS